MSQPDERHDVAHMGMVFTVDEAGVVLERTPAVLRALLADLPRGWIICDEGPDTFSPFENVGHLIEGEKSDWITRARTILDRHADRRLQPFDRFAHRTASSGKTMAELLAEFEDLRRTNVATLRGWNLTAEDLERVGEHPEFGMVTLRQLLSTWVVHDLGHIGQIVRVMAKRYRAEVGPWEAYLPVLGR